MRAFKVPQQLRGPHPAVTAFQEEREHVSRAQIPRAARYLQGLVNAVAEMGWSACEWAKWIREHAERTDPLNGRLRLVEVTSCSHEELQPHMHGWSTHGPYR